MRPLTPVAWDGPMPLLGSYFCRRRMASPCHGSTDSFPLPDLVLRIMIFCTCVGLAFG